LEALRLYPVSKIGRKQAENQVMGGQGWGRTTLLEVVRS